MLDRRETPPVAPIDDRRAFLIARRLLATIVVLGGLLAAATWYKHSTCGCSGDVPYTTIGLWAGVVAATAFGMYLVLGTLARRR